MKTYDREFILFNFTIYKEKETGWTTLQTKHWFNYSFYLEAKLALIHLLARNTNKINKSKTCHAFSLASAVSGRRSRWWNPSTYHWIGSISPLWWKTGPTPSCTASPFSLCSLHSYHTIDPSFPSYPFSSQSLHTLYTHTVPLTHPFPSYLFSSQSALPPWMTWLASGPVWRSTHKRVKRSH